MCDLIINGGKALSGRIKIQGSKNSALPMMAAALLYRGISILHGCPKIADVHEMIQILQELGAYVWWNGSSLYIDCTYADGIEIPKEYTKKMRSSVILLGVLLARNGRGRIGYPGGCVIGSRPIDQHLYVLEKMGVSIHLDQERISADVKKMKGTRIRLEKVSVGATEQGILSAVTAEGITILENCAKEPEIINLCRYLQSMGAKIEGAGNSRIIIEGNRNLTGGEMKVPADRIAAGTYICAVAATRGKILMENTPVEEMEAFLNVYRKIGGQYKGDSGKLFVNGEGIHSAAGQIKTETYPGFPTDLQSLMAAVLITIPGWSCIQENIFENRFNALREMCNLGADIRILEKEAWIFGKSTLHGGILQAEDLRGGAALIIAALASKGESLFSGYHHVERGYEHLCENLCELGGNIIRTTGTGEYKNIERYGTD